MIAWKNQFLPSGSLPLINSQLQCSEAFNLLGRKLPNTKAGPNFGPQQNKQLAASTATKQYYWNRLKNKSTTNNMLGKPAKTTN